MERPHLRATSTAFAALLASALGFSHPAHAGLLGDTVSVAGRNDNGGQFVIGSAVVSDAVEFDLCTDLDVSGACRQRLQIDFFDARLRVTLTNLTSSVITNPGGELHYLGLDGGSPLLGIELLSNEFPNSPVLTVANGRDLLSSYSSYSIAPGTLMSESRLIFASVPAPATTLFGAAALLALRRRART